MSHAMLWQMATNNYLVTEAVSSACWTEFPTVAATDLLPCACLQAEDDLILQRDDGPSPSRATEEAMWGKITRLDDDLDAAIQKYLDVSVTNSLLLTASSCLLRQILMLFRTDQWSRQQTTLPSAQPFSKWRSDLIALHSRL